MTVYVTPGTENQGQRTAPAPPASGGGRGEAAPLVNSAISQQRGNSWKPQPGRTKADHFAVQQFEVNRKSLKIVREGKAFAQPPSSVRGTIDSFSAKSQRRLRLAAADADPALVSMFTATYADEWPTDGKLAKAQLNRLLVSIRRLLPNCSYLWVLEFQRRGAPHFHIFLSEPISRKLHHFLARTWTEIAAPGSAKHLRVHRHPRSFITWDMGTGSYVAKYLDKANQKDVPDGYANVGRFWGASRGLVPSPLRVLAEEMAVALFDRAPQAVKQAVRWLTKWHEAKTRGQSWARKSSNSYTIPTGAAAFRQICSYLVARPIKKASEWFDELPISTKIPFTPSQFDEQTPF